MVVEGLHNNSGYSQVHVQSGRPTPSSPSAQRFSDRGSHTTATTSPGSPPDHWPSSASRTMSTGRYRPPPRQQTLGSVSAATASNGKTNLNGRSGNHQNHHGSNAGKQVCRCGLVLFGAAKSCRRCGWVRPSAGPGQGGVPASELASEDGDLLLLGLQGIPRPPFSEPGTIGTEDDDEEYAAAIGGLDAGDPDDERQMPTEELLAKLGEIADGATDYGDDLATSRSPITTAHSSSTNGLGLVAATAAVASSSVGGCISPAQGCHVNGVIVGAPQSLGTLQSGVGTSSLTPALRMNAQKQQQQQQKQQQEERQTQLARDKAEQEKREAEENELESRRLQDELKQLRERSERQYKEKDALVERLTAVKEALTSHLLESATAQQQLKARIEAERALNEELRTNSPDVVKDMVCQVAELGAEMQEMSAVQAALVEDLNAAIERQAEAQTELQSERMATWRLSNDVLIAFSRMNAPPTALSAVEDAMWIALSGRGLGNAEVSGRGNAEASRTPNGATPQNSLPGDGNHPNGEGAALALGGPVLPGARSPHGGSEQRLSRRGFWPWRRLMDESPCQESWPSQPPSPQQLQHLLPQSQHLLQQPVSPQQQSLLSGVSPSQERTSSVFRGAAMAAEEQGLLQRERWRLEQRNCELSKELALEESSKRQLERMLEDADARGKACTLDVSHVDRDEALRLYAENGGTREIGLKVAGVMAHALALHRAIADAEDSWGRDRETLAHAMGHLKAEHEEMEDREEQRQQLSVLLEERHSARMRTLDVVTGLEQEMKEKQASIKEAQGAASELTAYQAQLKTLDSQLTMLRENLNEVNAQRAKANSGLLGCLSAKKQQHQQQSMARPQERRQLSSAADTSSAAAPRQPAVTEQQRQMQKPAPTPLGGEDAAAAAVAGRWKGGYAPPSASRPPVTAVKGGGGPPDTAAAAAATAMHAVDGGGGGSHPESSTVTVTEEALNGYGRSALATSGSPGLGIAASKGKGLGGGGGSGSGNSGVPASGKPASHGIKGSASPMMSANIPQAKGSGGKGGKTNAAPMPLVQEAQSEDASEE